MKTQKQNRISKEILKYRKKNKLSQQQFANLIGETKQLISAWELSKSLPSYKSLALLVEVLRPEIVLACLYHDVGKHNL